MYNTNSDIRPWVKLFLVSFVCYACISIQGIPFVIIFGSDSDSAMSAVVGELHLLALGVLLVGYVFAETWIEHPRFQIPVFVGEVVCAAILVNGSNRSMVLVGAWSFFFTLDSVSSIISLQTVALRAKTEKTYETILSAQTTSQGLVWGVVAILCTQGYFPDELSSPLVFVSLITVVVCRMLLLMAMPRCAADTGGCRGQAYDGPPTTVSCEDAIRRVLTSASAMTTDIKTATYLIIVPLLLGPVLMVYKYWISFYMQPFQDHKSAVIVIAVCGVLLPLTLIFKWGDDFDVVETNVHLVMLMLATIVGWIYVFTDDSWLILAAVVGTGSFVARFVEEIRVTAIVRNVYMLRFPTEPLGLALLIPHVLMTGSWHLFVTIAHHHSVSGAIRIQSIVLSITALFVALSVAQAIRLRARALAVIGIPPDMRPTAMAIAL